MSSTPAVSSSVKPEPISPASIKPEPISHDAGISLMDSDAANHDLKTEPKPNSRKRLFSSDKDEGSRKTSHTEPTDKKHKTNEHVPTTSLAAPAGEKMLPSEQQIDDDLKIALERLKGNDCKNSNILPIFEKFIGEERFSTLKNLFTAEAGAEKITKSDDSGVNEVQRLNGENTSQLACNEASQVTGSVSAHPEIETAAKEPQTLPESPVGVRDEKLSDDHTSNWIDLMEFEVEVEEADVLRCNPQLSDKGENAVPFTDAELPVPSTDALELECISTTTPSNEALKLTTEHAGIVVKQEKIGEFQDKVRAIQHEYDGEIITIDDDECDVEKLMATPGSPFSPIEKREMTAINSVPYATKASANESRHDSGSSTGDSPNSISLRCSFIGCNFVTSSSESFQFHTLSKHVMMNVASPCQACNCSDLKCEQPINERASANVNQQVKEEKVESDDTPATLSVIKEGAATTATLATTTKNVELQRMKTSPAPEAQANDHLYMLQIAPTSARPTVANQTPQPFGNIVLTQQKISMPVRLIPQPANSIQHLKRLRPWLDGIDGKPSKSVTEMLAKDCILNIFKCMGSNCHAHFTDSLQFATHLFEHGTAQPFGSQVAYFSRCAYCPFSSAHPITLTNHLIEAHKYDKFSCSLCFYRSVDARKITDHQKMYHKAIGNNPVMKNDSMPAPTFLEALNHAKAAAVEMARGMILNIPCTICKAKFYLTDDVFAHLRDQHAVNGMQSVRCIKCQKEFTFGNLQLHLDNCLGIMKLNCVFCKFRTNEQGAMRTHLINRHPSNHSFFLERCIGNIAMRLIGQRW